MNFESLPYVSTRSTPSASLCAIEVPAFLAATSAPRGTGRRSGNWDPSDMALGGSRGLYLSEAAKGMSLPRVGVLVERYDDDVDVVPPVRDEPPDLVSQELGTPLPCGSR